MEWWVLTRVRKMNFYLMSNVAKIWRYPVEEENCKKSTIWSVCRQVFTVEEYFRNFRRERNIFKCCRRDARAAEERCAVIWKHLSPRFRINAVEKLSGWKATGGARVLVSRSGRGGCVTLVWVLTGHRGGRRAEQGRRRQLAVEEEEEAAASIANSTPSTHRPAVTLTFLSKARAHHSPAHFGKQ